MDIKSCKFFENFKFKKSTQYAIKNGKMYYISISGFHDDSMKTTRKIKDWCIHVDFFKDYALPYRNFYLFNYNTNEFYESRDNSFYTVNDLVEAMKKEMGE